MLRIAHRYRHFQLMGQCQVAGAELQKHKISKPLITKLRATVSEARAKPS